MVGEVRIDDTVIRGLLQNPAIREAFPELSGMFRQQKSGCNCRKQAAITVPDYERIRFWAANLPVEGKIRLKQLLKASTVSVVYAKPDGKRVKLKF